MAFTMTVFTDLHNGDFNYNDFDCTNALKKLRKILEETEKSDCFVSLGDLADYLKNGDIEFYKQAVEVFEAYGIRNFNDAEIITDKLLYHVLGNHESAYVLKNRLSAFIPYVPGVGSCYVFKREGVLFVVIDANFDRATGLDFPEIMRTSVRFVLPQKQKDYLISEVSAKIDDAIKSIVVLSHISCNVIEETSYLEFMSALQTFSRPITVFEGHFHTEQNGFITDKVGKILAQYYTLPAVTTGKGKYAKPNDYGGYRYYTLTFNEGILTNVSKHLTGEILLD